MKTLLVFYGSPELTKYSWQSVQAIHIIVDNGHIMLEQLNIQLIVNEW
jgi:hypothetical protein